MGEPFFDCQIGFVGCRALCLKGIMGVRDFEENMNRREEVKTAYEPQRKMKKREKREFKSPENRSFSLKPCPLQPLLLPRVFRRRYWCGLVCLWKSVIQLPFVNYHNVLCFHCVNSSAVCLGSVEINVFHRMCVYCVFKCFTFDKRRKTIHIKKFKIQLDVL